MPLDVGQRSGELEVGEYLSIDTSKTMTGGLDKVTPYPRFGVRIYDDDPYAEFVSDCLNRRCEVSIIRYNNCFVKPLVKAI